MSHSDLVRWAGQMLSVSPKGHITDAGLTSLIEEQQVGGVILFRRSCPSSDAVRHLIESMQRRAVCKMMVMVDQEGGRIQRLSEDHFLLPSARELAEKKPAAVEHEVYLVAKRLREIGFNVNLAPVLDIDSNPDNPVIGDRSFGSDLETVWTYAEAYRRGLERSGLIACGKHFPGHGDTDTDSHHELPIVTHDEDGLRRREIEPFRRVIEKGYDMIMVAHVLYESLDPDEPATLSKKIATDLLRGELGFRGVAVADDLEMKAVRGRYPVMELTRRLVMAGMDVLPVCNSYELAAGIHRAIIRLVEAGDIPEGRIKASHDRIVNLKHKYGLIQEDL